MYYLWDIGKQCQNVTFVQGIFSLLTEFLQKNNENEKKNNENEEKKNKKTKQTKIVVGLL